jgi:hypothetical protein
MRIGGATGSERHVVDVVAVGESPMPPAAPARSVNVRIADPPARPGRAGDGLDQIGHFRALRAVQLAPKRLPIARHF